MLGVSWQKFLDDEDSEEGLLIPGASFKLLKKDIQAKLQKPKGPHNPPKDVGDDLKQQHQFLMDVLLKNDKNYYPSMDPCSMVN